MVPTEYADFLTDDPDEKITATTTEDPFAAFANDDYGDPNDFDYVVKTLMYHDDHDEYIAKSLQLMITVTLMILIMHKRP